MKLLKSVPVDKSPEVGDGWHSAPLVLPLLYILQVPCQFRN